jgi:hypothetical protein
MKKSVAMKWIKALESGRYKQTTHALRRKDAKGKVKYCCLGVLTNMGKGSQRWVKNGCTFSLDDSNGALGKKIMKFSGIANSLGSVNDRIYGITSLVSLNDVKKLSFADIAQVIRRNWERLWNVTIIGGKFPY